MNADNNVNHGLYGAEATGASILNGGHTPPQSQALKQLYAYLDQIMASAPDALLMFGSGAPGRAEQVCLPLSLSLCQTCHEHCGIFCPSHLLNDRA